MSFKKNWIYIVILIIVLAGAGFAADKYLRPSKAEDQSASTVKQNSSGQNSRFGRGGNRGNFSPPISGTISSISGQTIIMTANNGVTKNVAVDSSTRIIKNENDQRTTLALSDLTVGETINVMASDSSSNNVTARMIFVGTFSPPADRGQRQGSGQSEDNFQNFDNNSSNQI